MSAHLSPRSSRPSGLHLVATVAVLVVTSGLLAACGNDSNGGSDDASVLVLDDDQARNALLTQANMPDGWVVSTDDEEDDDDDAPGCLGELDDTDEPDSESDADVDFEADDELGLPALTNGVASFKSERDVTEAMEAIRDALEDCDNVDYTDPDDGTQIVLDFDSNDEKSSPDVDDQFNLTATGTISNGLEFPFGLWLSVVRVDNHTTSVLITDLSEDSESMLNPFTKMAVDRLVAVIKGEEPEVTQGPAPGTGGDPIESGDDTDDGDDDAFEQLPIDGGLYTWESGVSMKLTVDRVELWGKKSDFCGDGSCGIADPDDTRVVLKYEVTVPADASEPFDASSCPGQMYPTSGSDDDALSGVFGDFAKSIDGKIFPGATKTGFDEYYIEKAYADQAFYIESACGDFDYDGQTAYFVGSFNTV